MSYDPNGIDQHAPGAKLDAGKPTPHQHMRAVWPHIREWLSNYDDFEEMDAWWGGSENLAWDQLVEIHDDLARQWRDTAMAYGAEKYTPDGWRHVPDAVNRYREAGSRHLLALLSGQGYDYDSKLHHLDHFYANAWFVSVLDAG